MSRRQRSDSPDLEWDFRSFPTFYGGVIGAFLSFFLTAFFGFTWLIALIFLLSWGTIHIATHWLRRRTLDKLRNRVDEEERERRALARRQAAALGGEEVPAAATIRRKRRRRRTQP